MGSNAISDLYQRYKIGTKRIVQWLAETATKRSKGTTVFAAPNIASNRTGTKSPISITTKDLVRLAENIAATANAKKPAPEGIDSILIILRDVIAGRRECAEWHAMRNVECEVDAEQRDRSHVHFVETLQLIFDHLSEALRNSAAAREKRKGKKGRKSVAEDKISNLSLLQTIHGHDEPGHEGLSVEALSLDDGPRKAPSPTFTLPDKPEYKLQTVEEDMEFALWCFLQTGQDIRQFVRTLWTEYKEGKITVQVAGVVTNEAFAILAHAAQELADDFPKLNDFDEVATFLDITVSTCDSRIEDFAYKSRSGSTADQISAIELLCIPAYTALVLIRASWSAAADDFDAKFNAEAHARTIHGFAWTVLYGRGHLEALSRHPKRAEAMGGLDILTKDLVAFSQHRELHLHCVVAFQISMDIFDIVDLVRWHQCHHLDSIRRRIQHFSVRFEEAAPQLHDFPLWRDHFEDRARTDGINRLIDDGVSAPMVTWKGDNVYDAEHDGSMSEIYCMFPVLCGWVSSSLSNLYHDTGVQACNNGRVVMAMAHLYRACKISGLLKADWKDMDFVIQQQGPKALGLREPSAGLSSMLSAAKRYGIAAGNELRHYARNRDTPAMAQRVDIPSYADMVSKRTSILHCTSAFHAASRSCEGSCQRSSNLIALYKLAKDLLAEPRADIDSSVREQWLACRKLTPVQLLSVLKTSLVAEETSLNFEYHGFAVKCANNLDFILKRCDKKIRKFRRVYGSLSGYYEYEMVDDILWEAAATENEPKGSLREHSILGWAAEFLAAMLEMPGPESVVESEDTGGQGGMWLTHARTISSGSLAEDMKPTEHKEAIRKNKWRGGGLKVHLRPDQLAFTQVPMSAADLERKASAAAEGELIAQLLDLRDFMHGGRMNGKTYNEWFSSLGPRLSPSANFLDVFEEERQVEKARVAAARSTTTDQGQTDEVEHAEATLAGLQMRDGKVDSSEGKKKRKKKRKKTKGPEST